MKKLKAKKLKKLTPPEEKIIDQAAQQFAEIVVRLFDEQNAVKSSSTDMNQTPKKHA